VKKMNILDIAIVVFVGLGFLLGWKYGLMRAVFVLGGFVIGILAASKAYPLLIPALKDYVKDADLREVISFVAIFLIVLIIVNILANVIYKGMKLFGLAWLDKGIGGLCGIIVALILVGLGLTLLEKHPILESENMSEVKEWLEKSLLVPIVLPAIRGLIDKLSHEFLEKKKITEFIHTGLKELKR